MVRDSSVLLCGAMDAVGMAIAGEIRAARRPLIIGTTKAGVAKNDSASEDVVIRGDLATVAGGLGIAARAWRRAGSIDALILNPDIACGSGTGREGSEWERQASMALKVPFFLARDFSLRVGPSGGKVILVIGPGPRVGGQATPSRILSAGLATMAQGLAKAVPESIRVSSVVLDAPAAGDRQSMVQEAARAVRFLVEGGISDHGAVIEIGRV